MHSPGKLEAPNRFKVAERQRLSAEAYCTRRALMAAMELPTATQLFAKLQGASLQPRPQLLIFPSEVAALVLRRLHGHSQDVQAIQADVRQHTCALFTYMARASVHLDLAVELDWGPLPPGPGDARQLEADRLHIFLAYLRQEQNTLVACFAGKQKLNTAVQASLRADIKRIPRSYRQPRLWPSSAFVAMPTSPEPRRRQLQRTLLLLNRFEDQQQVMT